MALCLNKNIGHHNFILKSLNDDHLEVSVGKIKAKIRVKKKLKDPKT